jgi:hypothetical protein
MTEHLVEAVECEAELLLDQMAACTTCRGHRIREASGSLLCAGSLWIRGSTAGHVSREALLAPAVTSGLCAREFGKRSHHAAPATALEFLRGELLPFDAAWGVAAPAG